MRLDGGRKPRQRLAQAVVRHIAQRLGGAAPAAARIDARAALGVAMATVHPGVKASFRPAGGSGATARFDGGAFFHSAAEVTRVLVPQDAGGLAEAFLVQTWTQRANLLDHTLVSGTGEVLNVERRTANDSYNVFTEDPAKTPQGVVNGPGAGTAASPAGGVGRGTRLSIAGSGHHDGPCLVPDRWEGIEQFLEPGFEVLVAADGGEVADWLDQLSPARASAIGRAAKHIGGE